MNFSSVGANKKLSVDSSFTALSKNVRNYRSGAASSMAFEEQDYLSQTVLGVANPTSQKDQS